MSRQSTTVIVVLFVAASVLIGRASVEQNTYPFSLHDYSIGTGGMPFQGRYLMVPVLHWAERDSLMIRVAAMLHHSVRNAQELAVEIVNCFCLMITAWLTLRLRDDVEDKPLFPWLAPCLFLWVVAITYVVRYDQRVFYPYDFVSMVFFTLGLIACLEGRTWLLLGIMLLGTYNRESTIALLPVWLILNWKSNRRSALVGGVVGSLIWIAVKIHIHSLVPGQSSGIGIAWRWDLAAIIFPHHWAQTLSVGGYLIIPIFLFRGLVKDQRLKLMWVGCSVFLACVLTFGTWNETRIFGEISALVAVTAASQFEESVVRRKVSLISPSTPVSGTPGRT